jgi:hypothetical protein
MKRIPVIAAFVLLFSALIAGPVVAWRYRPAQLQQETFTWEEVQEQVKRGDAPPPPPPESEMVRVPVTHITQSEQEGLPVVVTIKQGDRSWSGEVYRVEPAE